MFEVAPDTRIRLSLEELDGVSFKGGPDSVELDFAASGERAEVDPECGVKPTVCPELVTCTWELDGVRVSAQIDVVADSYCTLGEIRAYRSDQYANTDVIDSDVMLARSRAIEVIEREANRYFQPVVRTGSVDRPNCSRTSIPFIDGGICADIIGVVGAESSGLPVRVDVATTVSLCVPGVPVGGYADVVLKLGMKPTPVEVRAAVVALAAYYLVPKAGPDNATSESTEAGVINYIVAGVGGAATSLPEVNAVISRYGVRNYLVG